MTKTQLIITISLAIILFGILGVGIIQLRIAANENQDAIEDLQLDTMKLQARMLNQLKWKKEQLKWKITSTNVDSLLQIRVTKLEQKWLHRQALVNDWNQTWTWTYPILMPGDSVIISY